MFDCFSHWCWVPCVCSACVLGTFFVSLLADAYHIPETTGAIRFTNATASDQTFGWALGAMLFEQNLLPWIIPPPAAAAAASTNSLTYVLLACLVLALFGWAASVMYYRKKLGESPLLQGPDSWVPLPSHA